jgi:c-di-GMP phosphodiesterase
MPFSDTQQHPVLSQLALGYSAIVDAQRAVIGSRLTISLPRADAVVDGAALLAALHEVWPAPETAPKRVGNMVSPGTVALNVVGEPLLMALLDAQPQAPFALEVPSFVVAEHAASLAACHAAGSELWLKGRTAMALPAEQRAWFRELLFELPEAPPTSPGKLGTVALNVASIAALDAAVKQGAVAGAGWPIGAVPAANATRQKVAPEMQVVLELINRVDAQDPIERLEATLKSDPSLAFRLLRYMNSAAFGFSVEISSFRHALMMLGYPKLKRWLALLLVSASKDAKLKTVMHAAVRRGLVMEELARSSGDAEMKGEMFICGVFSMLDRLLAQPLPELLANVPVPERVRQALGESSGPFVPYLELVCALEASDPYALQECADALMLSREEVNRALLAALYAARQLD